ncbi:MAG: beta-glucuronidase [Clostridia bacterium]|nr:beta-glucuronidase [Clostridia bacterium]
MARLFNEHKKRHVLSLNGAWRMKPDYGNMGIKNEWYGKPLDEAVTVFVPSVWNSEFGMLDYEGTVWYEKCFHFEGGNLSLTFGAVMTECKVWLDGVPVGSHYGGFCQFEINVPSVSVGEHRLTLAVNNSFDKQSIPQVKVDWYHYGGIIRDVEAHTLSGVAILNHRLEYTLDSDSKTIAAKAYVELYNSESKEVSTLVTYKVGDVITYSAYITLGAHETRIWESESADSVEIEVWDTDSPKLYTVEINTDTDDLFDRVGFRRVEVSPEGVMLNGKLTELCGVNRHEEHPELGFAFPKSLMKRDIDIMRDIGCNTVRGSHYPPSRYFNDMLDECGMLFWCEIPMWGWGFSVETLGDDRVIERGLAMHREMVKYYYNHPSIIIFGMHNEIHTENEVAIPLTKKYYEFLKANGGNRIITYATDKPMKDLCLEYCDLIAINAYFGWYEGTKDSWAGFLEGFAKRRRELGMENKPVIFSEFGAAALYGHHTFDNIHWTEEYQAELISHAIKLFHECPMCCGFYVWQFADIRTCLEAGINRARGFNNKGILNEYRKPKLAYYRVRELYREFMKK